MLTVQDFVLCDAGSLLHHLHFCHLINAIIMVPINVENRIWGDGNGTEFGVMLEAMTQVKMSRCQFITKSSRGGGGG
jgi:hypothetical protein